MKGTKIGEPSCRSSSVTLSSSAQQAQRYLKPRLFVNIVLTPFCVRYWGRTNGAAESYYISWQMLTAASVRRSCGGAANSSTLFLIDLSQKMGHVSILIRALARMPMGLTQLFLRGLYKNGSMQKMCHELLVCRDPMSQ